MAWAAREARSRQVAKWTADVLAVLRQVQAACAPSPPGSRPTACSPRLTRHTGQQPRCSVR